MKKGLVKWKNITQEDDILVAEARNILANSEDWRIEENHKKPLQVFLLGQGYQTNFFKDTFGGMMQSKKYFHRIAAKVDARNAMELAERLKDRSWSEFH